MEKSIRRVLIVGATSAIAHEAARLFAAQKARLFLVARKPERLAALASDLRVRGADQVETFRLDINDLARHPELLAKAAGVWGGLDAALIAHGNLPEQISCEQDPAAMLEAFQTNCLSVISLVTLLAEYFEQRRCGLIAVITSVAGDRGRRSNYVYGAAKGAVAIFLEGLRGRLLPAGVSVVTIKPGPVDTPMTAAVPKGFLFASARTVGKGVYRAMMARKQVVYVPWFWRWIMSALRMLPEVLFRRLDL